MNIPHNQLESMMDSLVNNSWFEWHNAIPKNICLDLLNEVKHYNQVGALQPAGIGRGHQHQLAKELRRDQIKWLNGSTPAQIAYLAIMNTLQQELNRALFLGLFEYECHFAVYNKGDFYKKHKDSFKGNANRIVTTVLYLNQEWQADWGGELIIYDTQGTESLAKILPQIGKVVIFMSENLPHEVATTLHPRSSIAGWFRVNNTNSLHLDPAL